MTNAYSLELTNSCNNRCIFCATDHHISYRSMEQLRFEICRARESGAERLDLSGGEPTIHPRIADIAAMGKRLKFDLIYLKTNGRKLADMNFLRRLMDSGVNEVLVGIHGHNPEVQDALTCRPGSFDEAVLGIRNCLNAGVKLATLSVVTSMNYKYLPEITKFMFSIVKDHHAFAYCYPTASSYKNFDQIVPWYRDVQPYLLETLRLIESCNSTSNLDNIPLCIIPGHERYCNFLTTGGDLCHPIHEYGPRCPECLYYAICDGMPPTYTRTRGWDEFVPVTRPREAEAGRSEKVVLEGDKVMSLCEAFVEKSFGGVLWDRNNIAILTPRGVEVIKHFDGRTTLREIREKFGEKALDFAVLMARRGFAQISNPLKKARTVSNSFSYITSTKKPNVKTGDDEFEYSMYRPLSPYPQVSLA
jgi:hypothetical protein